MHRAAAALTTRRVSCLVAPGTFGVPDCRHLPGAFLDKLGYGKLPGDFRFRLFGRQFYLPVATTVLVSLVAALLVRVL